MTSVKYFHSAMTDAPVLNGTAGSLIGVLDACLVNGFSLRTVDSLTVAANVATANISAGHGYEPDTIVLIAGATPASLNGEKRVLTATTNTITFAAPGVADGTATGTISARLAPAGWQKPFSGTNLAVYRSPNVAGTREFLRVDDTGTTDARVVGYENMTDVNTGTGSFPTSVQQSGGLFWPKASSTSTTARAWTVIADDRTFWYWANTHTTTASLGTNGVTHGFGDFSSYKSGDAFSCQISGAVSTAGSSTGGLPSGVHRSTSSTATDAGIYLARSFTAIGGSVLANRRAVSYTGIDTDSGTILFPYPNGPDNGLILSPMDLLEVSGTQLRGRLRGPYWVPQVFTVSTFNWRDKVDGQGPLSGRRLLALKGNSPATTNPSAVTVFFDITGPW